jgi:hypothetical protein
MFKLSTKFSKAASLLEITTGPHHVAFSDQIFLNQTFALVVYVLKFSYLNFLQFGKHYYNVVNVVSLAAYLFVMEQVVKISSFGLFKFHFRFTSYKMKSCYTILSIL